ncbi:plant neutral invertase family protein [Actinidia rufa]|uniref:Plant neutral invertase family protein n=1 Tax=Actinidia rufa TaxID=165716 RepID=A0A7J0EHH6_9ERIC|nr:plant neutral invertase family protein [Actinidia rufa]
MVRYVPVLVRFGVPSSDATDKQPLNYDQVSIFYFIPSAHAFLLKEEKSRSSSIFSFTCCSSSARVLHGIYCVCGLWRPCLPSARVWFADSWLFLFLNPWGSSSLLLAPVAPTVTLTSCLDPRTATVADTSPGPVPDLSHIQSQLGILQSQLGYLLQQQPSGSIATLATGTPIAFHAKTSHPTWVLDSGANDHMTGTLSLSGSDATTIHANLDGLPHPIPLFDSLLYKYLLHRLLGLPSKFTLAALRLRPLC